MKVYIETSVPNFLFSKQDSKEKQQITEKFFNEVLPKHEAFVSDIYILEAEQAPPEKAKQLKSIVETYHMKVLEMTKDAEELAQQYQQKLSIPKRYFNDVLHIAIATVYNMDVIVSWNLTHIVKLRTMLAVEDVNKRFKYRTPHICTPEEV